MEPTHLNTNLESKIKEDGGLTESVEHQTNIFFWNSDCSKVVSRQNCYQTKCLTVFLWLYFLGSCLAEVSFTSHSFGVYKILGDGGVLIYLTYPFPQNFRYYHREDIYSGFFYILIWNYTRVCCAFHASGANKIKCQARIYRTESQFNCFFGCLCFKGSWGCKPQKPENLCAEEQPRRVASHFAEPKTLYKKETHFLLFRYRNKLNPYL